MAVWYLCYIPAIFCTLYSSASFIQIQFLCKEVAILTCHYYLIIKTNTRGTWIGVGPLSEPWIWTGCKKVTVKNSFVIQVNIYVLGQLICFTCHIYTSSYILSLWLWKNHWLSVISVEHWVSLAGFCLPLYSPHKLDSYLIKDKLDLLTAIIR